MTFAEKVISFNRSLSFNDNLPGNIAVMNPFIENPDALAVSERFYKKFYSDLHSRKLILGINPGRLGAGSTGIPFTDTKRLNEVCGIPFNSFKTHEPSSVFIYHVIQAYGGPVKFYRDFYINSVCPLGFVIKDKKGKLKNYNYYDSAALLKAATPFIIRSVHAHIGLGCETETVYCMGSGKNFQFLTKLNEEHGFFQRIIPLEHPRYIIQYKSKQMDEYIALYLKAFQETGI